VQRQEQTKWQHAYDKVSAEQACSTHNVVVSNFTQNFVCKQAP